jgi:hypothetical protein
MSQSRTIDVDCIDEDEPISLNSFVAKELLLLRRLHVHLLSGILVRAHLAGP